ncbi:hypothetical protein NECID01_2107 [Nematocida sp. AWRm77]|nr:hypothetical protein NECID01_2107 [Nematocida sp. AWRm77]
MNVRVNELLKEIHRKDEDIGRLEGENRSLRKELCSLSGKLSSVEQTVYAQSLALRQHQLQAKRKEQAISRMEKACQARIRRESVLKGVPKEEQAHRILVLEWIIKELSLQHSLPYADILSLSEICKENDSSLLALLRTPSKSTDLLEYLNTNGVKSMLDIQIDDTLPPDQPNQTDLDGEVSS